MADVRTSGIVSRVRSVVSRDHSHRIAGAVLVLWGLFSVSVGLANYGSVGSWWYFDVWRVVLGVGVLLAGGVVLFDRRGHTAAGLVAAGLLVLDRVVALALVSVGVPLLVGAQAVVAVGVAALLVK